MKTTANLVYFVLILIFCGCSPSRFVKPLQENQKSVGAHLGGQLIRFGADEVAGDKGMIIPIPFASLTAGYGIKKGLTGFASLHLTDLAYQNVHLEVGGVKQLFSNADSTLGITTTPQLNFVYAMTDGRAKLWPQLDINAYWHYKKSKDHFAYAGVSNWFELAATKAHGETQTTFWIPNVQLGHQFTKTKMDYFIEMKYVAPFHSNQKLTVNFWKPFGMKKGAVGVYVGLRKKF